MKSEWYLGLLRNFETLTPRIQNQPWRKPGSLGESLVQVQRGQSSQDHTARSRSSRAWPSSPDTQTWAPLCWHHAGSFSPQN